MRISRLIVVSVLTLCSAVPASAQAVKLEFHDGKVTLTAQNAPLRTILTEWARQGGTQMVNVEKVTGAPVTLQLTNVPEIQALDTILRGSAGYVVGLRPITTTSTQSAFDRILLVPTAGTAAVASRPGSAPPPFVQPQPSFQPPPDPDDNPTGDVPPDDERPNRPGARPQGPQPPPAAPQPATPSNPFGVAPGSGSARPGTISPAPPQPQRPRSQPDNEP